MSTLIMKEVLCKDRYKKSYSHMSINQRGTVLCNNQISLIGYGILSKDKYFKASVCRSTATYIGCWIISRRYK